MSPGRARNSRIEEDLIDQLFKNSGGSGPRITSRFILPFVASEIVLISIRRSEMAKPGAVVAMIVVAGGFLKCDSQRRPLAASLLYIIATSSSQKWDG